jgi:hypothetical protein
MWSLATSRRATLSPAQSKCSQQLQEAQQHRSRGQYPHSYCDVDVSLQVLREAGRLHGMLNTHERGETSQRNATLYAP